MHLYPPAPWSLYSIAVLVLKVAVAFPCPHLTSSVCVWRLVCVCRLGWTVHRVTAAVQRWRVCGCAVTSTLNVSPWRDREHDCLPWSASHPPRRRRAWRSLLWRHLWKQLCGSTLSHTRALRLCSLLFWTHYSCRIPS